MLWFHEMKFFKEMTLTMKIGFFICMCFLHKGVQGDSRRPVYNIAHMVNSIRDLEDFLERGANGIEMDVSFHRNGSIKNVYHGYPCDCYRICDEREKFDIYLNHIRDFVGPRGRKEHSPLSLLLFDLKVNEVSKSQKFTAGEEIAKHLITHLWNKDVSEPRISVVVSIGHTSDSDVVKGVKETFEKSNRGSFLNKLGFDVGLNDDLNSIRKMWSKLKVTSNTWQGDGITNCLRPLKDDTRLRQAIQLRDGGSYVDKVYDWTVDLTENMRTSFRLGVDAMLTNFPERIRAVLQEPEFRNKYRLADPNDNPFSRINVKKPDKSRMKRPSLDSYIGSLREMTVAFMGYFWDFYRLRLQNPGTLFPVLQDSISRQSTTAKNALQMAFMKRFRNAEHS